MRPGKLSWFVDFCFEVDWNVFGFTKEVSSFLFDLKVKLRFDQDTVLSDEIKIEFNEKKFENISREFDIQTRNKGKFDVGIVHFNQCLIW